MPLIRPPMKPSPKLGHPWRASLAALGLILALAPPLAAQSLQDWLVAQLKAQGYQNIAVSRTFLGRLRVVGHLGDMHREVVVNPRTGEVLRDVTLPDAQVHAGDTARPLLPLAPTQPSRRADEDDSPKDRATSETRGDERPASKDDGPDRAEKDDWDKGDQDRDNDSGDDDVEKGGDKGGHSGSDGGRDGGRDGGG